jgi:hypothetical protein
MNIRYECVAIVIQHANRILSAYGVVIVYNVEAILQLQFTLYVMLFPIK